MQDFMNIGMPRASLPPAQPPVRPPPPVNASTRITAGDMLPHGGTTAEQERDFGQFRTASIDTFGTPKRNASYASSSIPPPREPSGYMKTQQHLATRVMTPVNDTRRHSNLDAHRSTRCSLSQQPYSTPASKMHPNHDTMYTNARRSKANEPPQNRRDGSKRATWCDH